MCGEVRLRMEKRMSFNFAMTEIVSAVMVIVRMVQVAFPSQTTERWTAKIFLFNLTIMKLIHCNLEKQRLAQGCSNDSLKAKN